MNKHNIAWIIGAALLLLVLQPSLLWAQEDSDETQAQAPGVAAEQVVLPWFVMTARPVIGGGAGSMEFHWEGFAGLLDYNEEVNIVGANYASIIPEAFFMPTRGRHFIISASLPLGWGRGAFEDTDDPDKVIDGENFSYFSWFLTLGLGYQWYFGAEQRTNLFLMGHLGGGRFRFATEYAGETYSSDPMRAWYFDASVGSTHRFRNGFVLGGSLDFSTISFDGEAGGDDFFDVEVAGGLGLFRLNALLGYAWF